MSDLPEELLAALERGELSAEQLRQLIELEAQAVGLTFDEAVQKYRAGVLPKTHIGTDLEQLIELLPAA